MSRVVLSIGSNLGDRWAALAGATAHFRDWVTAVSPVFQTPPWGPVPQDDFLNAILIADDPAATPTDWLTRAHGAEEAAGRVRELRWGPRTLDVDVITVDQVRSADPVLVLPHPRAAERAFVLVPWLTVDPAAVLPGAGPVADLVAALPADERDGVRARLDLAPLADV